MNNADLERIINSDEVQSKLRPKIKNVRKFQLKKNPLKNLGVMLRLNPYAKTIRRRQIKSELAPARKAKQAIKTVKRRKISKKRLAALTAEQ